MLDRITKAITEHRIRYNSDPKFIYLTDKECEELEVYLDLGVLKIENGCILSGLKIINIKEGFVKI